jgi:murein tripeptide amidase MpaA
MRDGEQISTIPGYPCYRTVEEIYDVLSQMAANNPDLATWIDIGDSWDKVTAGGPEGYDVHALVLTSGATGGPKPKFLLGAQMHGNEVAGSEVATRFAEYLYAGYGTDPDITWMLDHFEFHLVPYINPDGAHTSETAYARRKNTDSDDGCNDPTRWGVDLDRNASFKWNMGGEQWRSVQRHLSRHGRSVGA